jgi:metal-responsive CopG/Arc/MetJ family transcriptional regulator
MIRKMSISIEESLVKKLEEQSERLGVPMSQLIEIGVMATIDRKALIRHTKGLMRQLLMLYQDDYKKRIKREELIKGVEL